MSGRTQTFDWLNAELDSRETELAAVRQELERSKAWEEELRRQWRSHLDNCVPLSNYQELTRIFETTSQQLAESQERELMRDDLINQIACRCTWELQDRPGQHVPRVPGSRQLRDALYSIRLQIESISPSQASAEGKTA